MSQDPTPDGRLAEEALSSVHVDGLAGDETAVVRTQESHRRRDFIGLALPAQGNGGSIGNPAGVPFRVGAAGVDASRGNDVDADVVGGKLEARLRAMPTIPILAADT